ncbi:MAG: hypothetical protein AAF417_12670 [Pseudomonadota bacterium]
MKIHRKILAGLLLVVSAVSAQERVEGTATVQVEANLYTIPIECDDAGRPELGFSTEPSRITRERTGRTSGVQLILRTWKETDMVVISLDRYVAWMPRPSSDAGVLELTLDMSPISSTTNGMPTLLSFDDWQAGDRPEGLSNVQVTADCTFRDSGAPSFKKVQGAE